MVLSQEDNSSPALMSWAFSLLKIPTLAKFGDSECEAIRVVKGIKWPVLLYPFYQKSEVKTNVDGRAT